MASLSALDCSWGIFGWVLHELERVLQKEMKGKGRRDMHNGRRAYADVAPLSDGHGVSDIHGPHSAFLQSNLDTKRRRSKSVFAQGGCSVELSHAAEA